MGHFGPKLEAERDETLSQYLRERGQKTSIFHFRLEQTYRTFIVFFDHYDPEIVTIFYDGVSTRSARN
jgi:hypothetical protein